mgnify:CR=1 FL=1
MASSDNVSEGDTFDCKQCGMALLITSPCKCDDGEPFFSCCGEQMKPATVSENKDKV